MFFLTFFFLTFYFSRSLLGFLRFTRPLKASPGEDGGRWGGDELWFEADPSLWARTGDAKRLKLHPIASYWQNVWNWQVNSISQTPSQ